MALSKPLPEILKPAKYERADIYALQALAGGVANEGQQKRALDWILMKAAQTYDDPFLLSADDILRFSGRRNVGLQILKLLKLRPEVIPE